MHGNFKYIKPESNKLLLVRVKFIFAIEDEGSDIPFSDIVKSLRAEMNRYEELTRELIENIPHRVAGEPSIRTETHECICYYDDVNNRFNWKEYIDKLRNSPHKIREDIYWYCLGDKDNFTG